jgi:hypothetical protein
MMKNAIVNSFERSPEMISLINFLLISTFERMQLTWAGTAHRPISDFKKHQNHRLPSEDSSEKIEIDHDKHSKPR